MKKISKTFLIKCLLKNASVTNMVAKNNMPKKEVENTRASQKEYKWFKEIIDRKDQSKIIIDLMKSMRLFLTSG